MKIAFIIVNSADSDEKPHSVASHLDLHSNNVCQSITVWLLNQESVKI